MVAMLTETNRVNKVDENIFDMNKGLVFEGSVDEILPYNNTVSYLNI
jgi:hypothetical protein